MKSSKAQRTFRVGLLYSPYRETCTLGFGRDLWRALLLTQAAKLISTQEKYVWHKKDSLSGGI